MRGSAAAPPRPLWQPGPVPVAAGRGLDPKVRAVLAIAIAFGAIGVIGPARLNYARVIPLVDYTARTLGRIMDG